MKTTKILGINLVKRLLSFVLLALIASLTACTSIKGKIQSLKVTNKIGAKQDASRAEKTSATKSAKAGEVVAKSDEVQTEPQTGADLFPQTETPAKTAYVDQSTASVAEPTLPMEEGKPEGQKPDDFFLREDSIPLPVIAVTKGTGSIDNDRPFMEKVIEEDPEFARKIEAKNSSDYETQWALIFERQDAAARQLAEAKRIRAEVIAEEQAAALAEVETDATPAEGPTQTIETAVPKPAIEIRPATVVSKESLPEPKTSATFSRPFVTLTPNNPVVTKVSDGFIFRSTLNIQGLPDTECVNLGEMIIRPVNNMSDNIYIKLGPKGQADGEFVKLNRESEIVAENMRSGLDLKNELLATYFRYPLALACNTSQGGAGKGKAEYEITVFASEKVDGIQMWLCAEGDSYEFTNASIMRKSNQPLVVSQNTIREAEKTSMSPQATDETSFAIAMAMITKQYAVTGNIFSPLTDRLSMVNVGPGNSKGHDNLMLAGVGGSFGGSAKTKAGLIFLGMILIVVLLYTLLYRCGALSDSLRLAFFGQPLNREQQLDGILFERPRETFLERKFNPNAFKALAKAGLQKLKPRRRTVKTIAETTPLPTALIDNTVKAEESLPVDDGALKSAEENPAPAKVGVVSPFTLAGPPKTEGPKDVKTQKTVLPPKRNIPAKTPTPAPASTAASSVVTIPLPSGNVPDFETLVNSVAGALAAQLGLNGGKTTGGQIPDETPSGSVKKPFRLGGNSPKPQGFKSVNAWEKVNGPPPKHQPKPKPLFPLPDQQEETVADEAGAQSGTGPNPPAPPQTDTAA